MEIITKTFVIVSGQNPFIQKKVFNKARIRKMAVAMNATSGGAGSFNENPFNYQQLHLRELRIIRGGGAIVSLDIKSHCRSCAT